MSKNVTNNKHTIADKMAKLDESVEWFYSEDFVIDQALDKYKTASLLAEEISKDLEQLKNEVEVLEDFTKD
jgi:exonuclease VII small subunit